MAMQIRLGRQQLSDLEVIRKIPAERLRVLAEQIESQAVPPLKPSELEAIVRSIVGGDDSETEALMRQLLSLSSLRWHRSLKVDDLLTGLTHGFTAAEKPWNEDELQRWKIVEPEFRRLLILPRVVTVSKALDLSYDYANLLQEVRIVTDIRPVFDENVTAIDGAVISFTLRLRYDSMDRNHGLSVAMNSDDVRKLAEECDRAIRKSEKAAALMNERSSVRTIISGADEDDSG
jgi:hypothetical protein